MHCAEVDVGLDVDAVPRRDEDGGVCHDGDVEREDISIVGWDRLDNISNIDRWGVVIHQVNSFILVNLSLPNSFRDVE